LTVRENGVFILFGNIANYRGKVNKMALFLIKAAGTDEIDIEGPDDELIEQYKKHLKRLEILSRPSPGSFGRIKDFLTKDVNKYSWCHLFVQAYYIGMVKRGLLSPPALGINLNNGVNANKEPWGKSIQVTKKTVIFIGSPHEQIKKQPFKIPIGDSESAPYEKYTKSIGSPLIAPLISNQASLLGWPQNSK
jgi:hypothetical protein